MIRAGVVGMGVVGRRRAAAIAAHPDLDLAATSDAAAETAALLDQPLDVVFVCLPNALAAPACLAALDRGLHVFCEKPPARTAAELLPVLEAAARARRVLMVGFNHRLHGSVQALLALHREGALGPLHSLRGVYAKPGNSGWRVDPAVAGGGILLDQGIHMLDLARLLAGELAVQAAVVRGEPVEDDVHALLRGARGAVVSLHSSAREPRCIFRLEAVYARGRATLDGILSGSMAYAPERLVVEVPGQPAQVREYAADRSWADEVAEMARAVVDGGGCASARHGDPADALALLRCIERIYEVGRT